MTEKRREASRKRRDAQSKNVPIAPPGQEGWTRHQENVAKLPIMERTGWWFWIEEFCLSNLNHHPVCAFGAATPPGLEGRLHFP
jgi:hypothetical protein